MKKQPTPALRIHRRIVGPVVWAKALNFHASFLRSFYGDEAFIDYAPGSALEGNLIHWMANHPYTPQRITGFELDPSYNDP
jgi:hypothetical protein